MPRPPGYALQAAQNLADVDDTSTARANLGVNIANLGVNSEIAAGLTAGTVVTTQFGSVIATPNASGLISITFGTAYPTACLMANGWLGDPPASGHFICSPVHSSIATTGFQVKITDSTTGNAQTSGSFRVDWEAKGY